MKKQHLFYPLLALSVVLAGCTNDETQQKEVKGIAEASVEYDSGIAYETWSEKDATFLTFSDSTVTLDDQNSGAVVEDGIVTIHTSGTYVLEGDAAESQVIVDAEDDGEVRLILNGVSLTSTTSAPIFVKQAENTVVSVEEGTTNSLTDASDYVYDSEDDEPSAALYSKDDLTINGTGTLIVNGQFNDGITGNDDVQILGATVEIDAVDDGIVGRDSFVMDDTDITIEAGGDGVKSSNDEDQDEANVVLESGSLTIRAQGDGIASENTVTVLDGEYDIVAGGGSPETIEKTEEAGMTPGGRPGFGEARPDFENGEAPNFGNGEPPTFENGEAPTFEDGEAPDMPEGEVPAVTDQPSTDTDTATEEEADTPSMKGIKAENTLTIAGGTITIDAIDDGLHSDNELTMQDGTVTVSTGDDAVHADKSLKVAGGLLQIDKSYEGLESDAITISDGTIYVHSVDDGVNINAAADRTGAGQSTIETNEGDGEVKEEAILRIDGGSLYVYSESDGLDSNTNIEMSGGTVVIHGPTSEREGAIDYDGSFTIEGGTVVAAGSEGMSQGMSDTSIQNSIMMIFPEMVDAGTTVHVEDSDGNVIAGFTPDKAFKTLVVSSPDLVQGEAYTLYTGAELSGEATEGYYAGTSAENGTAIVEFTLNSNMLYLDENGETDYSGGIPGGGQGMNRGQTSRPQ